MGKVLATNILEKVGYRFRTGLFGKQILQIGQKCQQWDTNTGHNDGPAYVEWVDANRYDAEKLLKKKE